MQKSPNFEAQVLRQVWFPGEHGCVGGGTKEQRGLSDGALQWMMNEIGKLKLGLEFEPNNVEDRIQTDPTINFDNEPGIIYQLMGTKPRNIIGSFDNELGIIHKQMETEQHNVPVSLDYFHESVKKRWQAQDDYRPENLWKFRDELEA